MFAGVSGPMPYVPPAALVVPPSDVLVLTADPRQQRQAVKTMLERAGLSIAEVARQLGVKRQSLHQYLNPSARRAISVDWLVRCAALCRCSVALQLPSE